MKGRTLLRLINFYPPYLGAGVRVRRIAPDLRSFEVELKLRFWNRNYVGSHFGGSLYSMCDPFFMLILIESLGRGYEVWDKSATIRFRRPGRSTVRASFKLTDEQINEIRSAADRDGRTEPHLTVQVVDDKGELIAEVEKILSVRKKAPRTERAAG